MIESMRRISSSTSKFNHDQSTMQNKTESTQRFDPPIQASPQTFITIVFLKLIKPIIIKFISLLFCLIVDIIRDLPMKILV